MENILQDYIVNKKTLAIIPAKQVEYESIVMEGNQVLRVRQTPLQLIKKACLDYWSSYEGRRQAVMYHTNFMRQVPIPISPQHGIYTFPTHATGHIDCHWIFFNNILLITEGDPSKEKSNTKTQVIFKNRKTLRLNISMHVLENQMNRTFECKYRIESTL